MNKKLLFLFFIGSLSAQGQTYIPLPDSNAYWIENRGVQFCCPVTFWSWEYQNTFADDTLVNGYVYHIITRTGYYYNWSGSTWYCYHCYFTDTAGYFRQDTLNHKVYCLDLSGNDTLLYDFNLNVGDILPDSYNQVISNLNYISSVDSVLLQDGRYHRRLTLGSNGTDGQPLDSAYCYLIEGIGSTFGLFGTLIPPFESGSSLECFSQNLQYVYPDTATQCALIVSEYSINNFQKEIVLYPNPATNEFTVESSKLKVESVEVYDVVGQPQISNFKPQTNSVDVSSLSVGIYFVRVRTEKGSITKKLIKQ